VNIAYETNGRGFLGWLVELPGAYLRGATQEEARSKLPAELAAYAVWLGIDVADQSITGERIMQSHLKIEDADSDILLDYDVVDYASGRDFERDCDLALVSARKTALLYEACPDKDGVDPSKLRKTFYGDCYATIGTQFKHIVDVQLYYLKNIGATAIIGPDLVEGRLRTIEAIRAKYSAERNRLYESPEERWTVRKVMRRLIWHDRIHARAIERMDAKLRALR
jgi:hypothetical protein